MYSGFLGEFVGTAVLILLGNGVVACVILKDSYGRQGGWIVITAGWCFAVLAGVLTALSLGSNGHLNPAVTIGVAVETGRWEEVPAYISAQLLGAMLGATLVWLHYLPHWNVTDDSLGKRACFCTAPAIRRLGANTVSEVIGTFVLVFVAAVINSRHVAPSGLVPGMGPLLVGLLVWAIGLSLGGATGYAINPARDLGPRIVHALVPFANKASSDWTYATVPIVGPVAGAVLAALLVKSLGI